MSPKKIKKAVSKKTPKKSGAKVKNTLAGDSIDKSVREFWEQLGWADISETFGDRTTDRGRRYGEGGHVESLWRTKDGKTLLAEVFGENDYTTVVTLEEGRKKNSFVMFSNCSCPVGSMCKHGVAAITRFLDCLAKEELIPLCVQIDDETWETYSTEGKKSILKVDFDEYPDDDEDWDDEDDTWNDDIEEEEPVVTKKKSTDETALNKRLQDRSKEELVALILQFHKDSEDIREYFEQEAFAESISKTSDADKLVQKSIKLIDKGINRANFYDYDYHGYGGPSLDLDPVVEIVKQFKRFDDPLPGLDKIARHLIKKGGEFVENTGTEDTEEIDDVFIKMADVLIASKTPPVKTILWAHEISDIGEYDLCGYAVKKILGHAWPVKTWSGVADALLEQFRRTPAKAHSWREFRTIVETLDKANRKNEATDFLRQEADSAGETEMLVDRLLEYNHLAEAKKIALQKRVEELKSETDRRFHWHDTWPDKLKNIAEKEKDWPGVASIEVAEFFESPDRRTIVSLLKTAKKMKVDAVIRKEIEKFLLTGGFPAFVSKSLDGKKPTPNERKLWPIPFFEVRKNDFVQKKKTVPQYDVLCEWAIDEKRPKDVLRWLDELSKQKKAGRTVDLQEVADAVVDFCPDRALTIYLKQAEHEMEATRNYPAGIRQLNKAKKALKKASRSAEWPKIMEDIRARHRRKSSLMKQLAEFERGSIVKQKRQPGR